MQNTKMIPQALLETKTYVKAVSQFWDEEEQRDFKTFLGLHPEQGDIIPDTDGLRKIRWSSSGHGKRGGARVIYYVYDQGEPIYLLFAYPKNVKTNLTEREKKVMRQIVGQIKSIIRERRG
ncbi:MAG: type II toxin-antitoxin system RelE/ParE family toxin [Selenomonas sp.]|uniref:type II toxin-antitoxin system RelE/ParE family toxin n=1 Tax=Selenomonas sp. TaxID=2053611 RepID=UPI0025D7DB71|nr:type II toxin-antitoxin system RelE/ParE family toxin [Selenomonas sp.]MCI6100448.1 type II toxin-antitoxin system RelE/ParE family toxin [Selenomonas sp.]MCI6232638.1 type II toxin-antitoxin system RelE/ParE family toxin [Selenomonas sp.]